MLNDEQHEPSGLSGKIQIDFSCIQTKNGRCPLPPSRPAGGGGAPQTSADVATRAEVSARPAVTHPATQTNVCGDKVSQLPSGGWSYFDTRPVAHPHAPILRRWAANLARFPPA